MSVIAPPPPTPPPPPPPSQRDQSPPAQPPTAPGASFALRVGAVITGLLIIGAAVNLFTLTSGRHTTTAHEVFAAAGSTLDIHTEAADVSLLPSTTGSVEVDRTVRAAPGRRVALPSLVGGSLVGGSLAGGSLTAARLELPSHCTGGSVDWLFLCSVHYVVHVPSGLEVRLTAGSGDVSAEGLGSAPLTVQVGSGDISVSEDQAAQLRLSTGSGDIDATGLVSAVTAVKSGSGDVELDFAQAPGRSVDADTGSGDLTIVVPRDQTSYVVSAKTGSGDLTNNVRSLNGAGPDGSGSPLIRAETGSGDLTLDYAG